MGDRTNISGGWMGVDYGSRRIGLAISDLGGRMAMPAEVLRGQNNPALDAAAVHKASLEYDIIGFVVGLPLNMNGTEGPQAVFTRRFAEALRKATGLQVKMHDERLSSAAADSVVREYGLKRGTDRKPIDNLAAQVTLQAFLDSQRTASADYNESTQ